MRAWVIVIDLDFFLHQSMLLHPIVWDARDLVEEVEEGGVDRRNNHHPHNAEVDGVGVGDSMVVVEMVEAMGFGFVAHVGQASWVDMGSMMDCLIESIGCHRLRHLYRHGYVRHLSFGFVVEAVEGAMAIQPVIVFHHTRVSLLERGTDRGNHPVLAHCALLIGLLLVDQIHDGTYPGSIDAALDLDLDRVVEVVEVVEACVGRGRD